MKKQVQQGFSIFDRLENQKANQPPIGTGKYYLVSLK